MPRSHERGRNGTEGNYGSWFLDEPSDIVERRVQGSWFRLLVMAYEKKSYRKAVKAEPLEIHER